MLRPLLFTLGIAAAVFAAGGCNTAAGADGPSPQGSETSPRGLTAVPDTAPNRRLVDAVMAGDLGGVKAALAQGASPEARVASPGRKESTPIAILAAHDMREERARWQPIFTLLIQGVKDANAADEIMNRTLLMAAVDMNDLGSVKRLVELGAKVNVRTSKIAGEWTPLHMAVMHDGMMDRSLTPVTTYLLDHGADVNAADARGATPLIMAAQYGKPDVVRALLAHGADPAHRDAQGFTALRYAGRRGGPEVEALLKDRTPMSLTEAARFGKIDRLRAALESGGDPNAPDARGTPPLVASVISGNLAAVDLLLKRGAKVEGADRQGQTALHLAAIYGNTKLIAYLLAHGAKIDARSSRADWVPGGATPLQFAVLHAQPEAVDLLIRKGANPKLGTAGTRPLDLIVARAGTVTSPPREGPPTRIFGKELLKRQDRILQRLLGLADVRKEGGMPLYLAAREGQIGIVELLLAKGADANGRGPVGPSDARKTAIMAAVEAWTGATAEMDMMKRGELLGPEESDLRKAAVDARHVIDLLLAHHADVNLADDQGQTPLMLCVGSNVPTLARKLISLGAKVDAQDRLGRTALMRAASENDIQTAKVLLEAKAAIERRDTEGRTALMLAIDNGENDLSREMRAETHYSGGRPALRREDLPNPDGHPGMVRFLLQHGAKVDVRDRKGRTALALAEKEGFTEVVKILKGAGAK